MVHLDSHVFIDTEYFQSQCPVSNIILFDKAEANMLEIHNHILDMASL
jgi:hypothetical protein